MSVFRQKANSNGFGRFTSGCWMPLSAKQRDRLPAILTLAVLAFLPFLLVWVAEGVAATDVEKLEVAAEPGGGVRATAHVLFPAPPAVVQALLADYPHWPDLFE